MKVKANYKDQLEQIQKAADAGLSEATAKELIDDLLSEIKGIKKADDDPVVRKNRFEDVDDILEPDKPRNIVELIKSDSKRDEIKKAQEMWDDCYIVSRILGVKPNEVNLFKNFRTFVKKSELEKAMDTTSAGAGLEWIPTEFSRDMVDLLRLEYKLASIFPHVKMPTDPFKFPRLTSDATAYLATENTNVTASEPGTGNNTLNAKTIKAYITFSDELEEDNIVPLLPLLKENIVITLASAVEDALINGDVSGTHQDTDVTASDDRRKAWKGLRKSVLDANKKDISTYNYQTLLQTLQYLGKYAAKMSQVMWIVGAKQAIKLLNLHDESGNAIVQTMDKIGPKATILTGQVAVLAGGAVVVSEKLREDLNATGTYDGTTDTKTIILPVRKDAWLIGDRRTVKLETDKIIKAGTVELVASVRHAFEDRIPDTESIIAMGYNINPAA